ncbi:MAG: hypothetical protein DRI48_08865 [Chloroflexi bacterium]|nr:MAG: hypothetical protein DRI48_08865 [Chloroflexota bacterium]
MQEQLSSIWLVADFFTHHYRVSGRLNVRSRKLADQLNDASTSFLGLEEAYVSNIERPADILTSHPTLTLRKDNIVAAVVARQQDGLRREQAYGSYFGTYLRKVFLTVPSFGIEGYLYLSSRLDLLTVFATGTDKFLLVLDGQMRVSTRPDVVFAGGAILVNKSHVGVFCEEEDEED